MNSLKHNLKIVKKNIAQYPLDSHLKIQGSPWGSVNKLKVVRCRQMDW